MAIAMPLPTRISQSHTIRLKQRLIAAQFGDGYSQTAPDGINSQVEEWDISWELLSQADRNTVVAALKQGATDVMTWTTPNDGVAKKFQIVPSQMASLYTEQILAGQYFNVSTSIVQVR